MGTTKADIREWLERAKKKGATHMIVACDQFDYEDHPVFVMPGEDPRERKEKLDQAPMQKVMEVYAVFLPWEEQLNAHRSFNYTPAPLQGEPMTEAEFQKKFGRAPVEDDLHRVNCDQAGTMGHFMCGMCPTHDKARFMCGCMATKLKKEEKHG